MSKVAICDQLGRQLLKLPFTNLFKIINPFKAFSTSGKVSHFFYDFLTLTITFCIAYSCKRHLGDSWSPWAIKS